MGDAAKKPPSPLKNFLSGGFGGMCLVMAGHPFDLIKVRLQTSDQYTGIRECVTKTVGQDGIRGLYRGMTAPLIGVTPIFAICFWGYDQGQRIVRSVSGMAPTDELSLVQVGIAGGYSALPTTLVMVPAERIKCILQIQGQEGRKQQYTGFSDVLRGIWKEGGITALYKGTTATLIRDIPGSVAYFAAYEALKRKLTPKGEQLNPLAVVCAGGMAGVANWSVAIPADVIKSRLQTAPPGTYSGLIDCVSKLLKQEGPKALFKGLGPAMLRAFPANAACFLGVEVSMKAMNSMW